ncbi:CRISPR-associated protein Cmr6 [Methanococcus voltae]|uniref:type III-B CRISPR module RAMP protein Cmr6 n=1 Tax=Methanococcus voltae TaxID=2188 RepID=UPI001AE930ED|nr:type III-B CRISPR module RAMP protein Cmr6 [Methanococcus voltae]MBP2143372.1 CRISPR-associated protein Cmr6 [Methanococcus voltae]
MVRGIKVNSFAELNSIVCQKGKTANNKNNNKNNVKDRTNNFKNSQKSNSKKDVDKKIVKAEKVDNVSNGNLGYLYYREYYEKLLNFIRGSEYKKELDTKNKSIKKVVATLKRYSDANLRQENIKKLTITDDMNNSYKNNKSTNNLTNEKDIKKLKNRKFKEIKLDILYPGLLIGSGYMHETSITEGEYKLGFFFDYTTGLPIVPGASVKGTLRSAFPRISLKDFKGKPISKNSELIPKQDNNKYKYLLELLYEILDNKSKELLKIKKLNNNEKVEFTIKLRDSIFEGINSDTEHVPIYNRDIFLDAEIYSEDNSNNDNNKLFEEDYITPHKEVFKEPIPLKFLKIGSNNKIKFNFLLNDSEIELKGNESITISSENKKELFNKILLNRGIGAKTKVGYGNLE